jgi:hypothetical protein
MRILLGLMSKAWGTTCVAGDLGFSDRVICRFRWANWSQLSGLGAAAVAVVVGIGASL